MPVALSGVLCLRGRASRKYESAQLVGFSRGRVWCACREVVAEHRPLHLSIVGGDPLVRYRELEVLLPQLVKRSHVQVVTSAFRPIPAGWAKLPNLQLSISIDGLQPEHDVRRKPATYERILHHIEGQHVAVHCTITSAMVKRTGYIPEFVDFWAGNPAVEKNLDEYFHAPARRE